MRPGDQFQASLFFKEASYEVKASNLQLSFNQFQQPSTWNTMKTSCIKKLQTIDPEIRSINYDFLEKGNLKFEI